MNIIDYYNRAKSFIIEKGYQWEIDNVNKTLFENVTADDFLRQYVWVIVNSGMKNQVAEKIYDRFMEKQDPKTIGHPGKREATILMLMTKEEKFNELVFAEDRLAYLETLPWIGPITKYHLARNLGLDYAKPDRHLVRIAEEFKFKDVQIMCRYISDETGDRIGVVDVILWRYRNLKG